MRPGTRAARRRASETQAFPIVHRPQHFFLLQSASWLMPGKRAELFCFSISLLFTRSRGRLLCPPLPRQTASGPRSHLGAFRPLATCLARCRKLLFRCCQGTVEGSSRWASMPPRRSSKQLKRPPRRSAGPRVSYSQHGTRLSTLRPLALPHPGYYSGMPRRVASALAITRRSSQAIRHRSSSFWGT